MTDVDALEDLKRPQLIVHSSSFGLGRYVKLKQLHFELFQTSEKFCEPLTAVDRVFRVRNSLPCDRSMNFLHDPIRHGYLEMPLGTNQNILHLFTVVRRIILFPSFHQAKNYESLDVALEREVVHSILHQKVSLFFRAPLVSPQSVRFPISVLTLFGQAVATMCSESSRMSRSRS
jgi:hypothetical protein